MSKLYFITEGGFRIECPEQNIISLGRRDEANQQQIDIDFAELGEPGVSRLHALIHVNENGVFLEDFNSRNGTFLNECQLLPLRHYPLAHQDKLKIGRIELILHIETQE